jgi:hypothetical protein
MVNRLSYDVSLAHATELRRRAAATRYLIALPAGPGWRAKLKLERLGPRRNAAVGGLTPAAPPR